MSKPGPVLTSVIGGLAAFALGLGAGLVLPGALRGRGGAAAPPAAPAEFVRGRPVLEDLEAGGFRLVAVGYGGPVQLVRRRCIQGSFDLAVFDRAGRPVHSVSNGEAEEDCRADFSAFAERGELRLIYHTLDVRRDTPAPWKVEAVVFRPGQAPACSAHVALEPEPADDRRIAELVAEARRGRDLYRSADRKDSQRGWLLMEHSLNRLRNAGVDRPDAAIAALREIGWADGAAAEQIAAYLAQLEEIKRIRARRTQER